jgi:outer membrane receptor protein involved in Fe transport
MIAVGAWAQEAEQEPQTEPEPQAGQQAEEPASVISEELTVTSRKTEELLDDIPLTIRAFTSEEMQAVGIDSIEAIANNTPGLHISNYLATRDDPSLRFRGMSVETSDRFAQNASAFVDGVYLPRTSQWISMEDVERVEVVKGPQSAFFGRSTFGGAVNLITKTPTMYRAGDISLTAGENGRQDVDLGISGPLGDKGAYRFFGRYYSYDGGWENNFPGETLGGQETIAGSLAFTATPSDSTLLKFRYLYSEDDDGPGAFVFWDSTIPNCGPFGGTSPYYCGELTISQAIPIGYDTSVEPAPLANWPKSDFGLAREIDLATFNLDWSGQKVSVSSQTSYLKEASQKMEDFTGDGTLIQYYDNEDTLVSEELRLTGTTQRFSWLAGLYYLDGEYENLEDGFGCQDTYFFQDLPFLPGCPIILGLPQVRGAFDLSSGPTVTVENTALFGSLTFQASDKVAVSLEARAAQEKLDYGQGILAEDGVFNQLEGEFDSFTPRLILDYKPSPDSTWYLNIARGNTPGKFNDDMASMAAPAIEAFSQQYGASLEVPEQKMWDYDVGWKGVFGGGAHRVHVAAYYMDWSDLWLRQFVQFFDTNADGVVDTNDELQIDYDTTAGSSDITGFEVYYSGRPSDYLDLVMSYNYNDAEYTEFLNNEYAAVFGTRDASGRTHPRSPKSSVVLSLAFQHPMGDADWEYFIRADGTFTGSSYTWAHNLAENGDATRANLRIGFENDRYRITLWMNNVTDDDTVAAIRRFSDMSNFQTAFWGGLPMPREAGLTFRVKMF